MRIIPNYKLPVVPYIFGQRKSELEDPHHLQQASMNVQSNEVLLAVIHRHEREGWRHELARETYLLKNAVGTDLETISASNCGAPAKLNKCRSLEAT